MPRTMTEKAIHETLEHWKSVLAYAVYESNGKRHKAKLTRNEVDYENSQLIVEFNMNDEISGDASITYVAWCDTDGETWAESEENIVRESYVDGILYRYVLSLKEV